MLNTWKQWEGHVVNGKFSLLRYLGGSERSAVFLTERRVEEGLAKAAIKLVHLSPQNVERQLERWRQAKQVPHAHLISLYDTGRCELDGMSLVYVVMEYAEENLAQILPSRALAPDEARAMLESVLVALAYLHNKDLVHGHIKPENILATADQLKLSSDGLCRSGESLLRPGYHDAYEPPENAPGIIPVAHTMSPACDVWSLGITLVEALTQKRPVPQTEAQQDPLVPETLPEPFLDIARHCLVRRPENRWAVAEIADRLDGRVSMPLIPAARPQGSRPADAPQPAAQPARAPGKRRGSIAPIAIGSALVLAAAFAAPKLLRRHTETAQIPAETPPVPAEASQVPAAAAQPAVVSAPLAHAEPTHVEPPPPPQPPPAKAFDAGAAQVERASKMPDPVPTSVHKEITSEEAGAAENASVNGPVHGDVAQRVDPEVLQSARDSIRGTVRVTVRVNVDRSGNVEDADLESAGPSKYFARSALQAAKLWKFTPPRVGSLGVLSTWSLRFEFTRDGTNVVPTQENP